VSDHSIVDGGDISEKVRENTPPTLSARPASIASLFHRTVRPTLAFLLPRAFARTLA
jgi:hypothetical protein